MQQTILKPIVSQEKEQSANFLSASISELHPDKIVLLISKNPKSRLNQMPNNKLLISKDFKVHRLLTLIRNKIQLNKQEALYLFANKTLLQIGQKVQDVYERFKSNDNILRLQFYEYQTFGGEQ